MYNRQEQTAQMNLYPTSTRRVTATPQSELLLKAKGWRNNKRAVEIIAAARRISDARGI